MFTRVLRWRSRLRARLADRLDLVLENVALRQQFAMYERRDRSRGRSFHGQENEQPRASPATAGRIVSRPVLGGLTHEYEREAA